MSLIVHDLDLSAKQEWSIRVRSQRIGALWNLDATAIVALAVERSGRTALDDLRNPLGVASFNLRPRAAPGLEHQREAANAFGRVNAARLGPGHADALAVEDMEFVFVHFPSTNDRSSGCRLR